MRTTQGIERGLGQALLLDQQFQRAIAPSAGGDFEHAGFRALAIEDSANVEALQKRAPRDVLGKLFDRDAGLDRSDVGLRQDELVEGNVARGAEGQFRGCHCHVLQDGRRETFSLAFIPSLISGPPLTLDPGPSAAGTGDAIMPPPIALRPGGAEECDPPPSTPRCRANDRAIVRLTNPLCPVAVATH